MCRVLGEAMEVQDIDGRLLRVLPVLFDLRRAVGIAGGKTVRKRDCKLGCERNYTRNWGAYGSQTLRQGGAE